VLDFHSPPGTDSESAVLVRTSKKWCPPFRGVRKLGREDVDDSCFHLFGLICDRVADEVYLTKYKSRYRTYLGA
jgi:hypothetical protein